MTNTEQILKDRIWVFVAYFGEDNIPYFSKLFNNHEELKIFSAEHSERYKNKVENYSSSYFDLIDKTFLSSQKQQILDAVEKDLMNLGNWVEPMKQTEIDRWKIMYGFTPNELKEHILTIIRNL